MALGGLAAGLVDDGISGLRQLPLTHLAFEPKSGATFSRSILTEKNLAPWQHVDGVEASPVGVSFSNAKGAGGKTLSMALFGVTDDSFLADRPQARAALAGPPGLILSNEAQKDGIEVGDRLIIAGSEITLPVVGFTYAGSYGHVDIAFTQLSTWQRLFYGDQAHGRFSAIALHVEGGVSGAALARADRAADTELITKKAAYAGSPGYSGETQTMTLIRGFLRALTDDPLVRERLGRRPEIGRRGFDPAYRGGAVKEEILDALRSGTEEDWNIVAGQLIAEARDVTGPGAKGGTD